MSTTGKGGHASAGTCGIAVMAKASIPGRSKTRLVPPLTFTEACDFNTAFLRDVADNIAAAARQAPIQGYVAFGPPESAAFFSSTLAPSIGLIDAWHPNFGDCLFAAIRSALLALALVTCAAARADETPEERMQRRFPQPVKVGDLIGLPVYDDNESTLGHVRQVVRTPAGKIQLIVSYSPWFGWWGRPVAVPIELVGIFGRQIAALDMSRQDFSKAPTWSGGNARPIPGNDSIRIALTRH